MAAPLGAKEGQCDCERRRDLACETRRGESARERGAERVREKRGVASVRGEEGVCESKGERGSVCVREEGGAWGTLWGPENNNDIHSSHLEVNKGRRRAADASSTPAVQ